MNNSQVWINAGYALFAQEGNEGIQVERLARILKANKSGFYHYFGDRSVYFQHLMLHHQEQVKRVVQDIERIAKFDPDFINVLINHRETVLFNMQLLRNRQIKLFEQSYNEANAKMDLAVLPVWSEHVGISDRPSHAMSYFGLVRDAIYARITPDQLNYQFLHEIGEVAKMITKETAPQEHMLVNN